MDLPLVSQASLCPSSPPGAPLRTPPAPHPREPHTAFSRLWPRRSQGSGWALRAHRRQGQACLSQTRVLGASASQRLAWPPCPQAGVFSPCRAEDSVKSGEMVCLEEAPCPRDSSELWFNSTCQAGLQFYQVCIVSAGPRRPPQILGTTLPSFPTSTPHRPSLSLVLLTPRPRPAPRKQEKGSPQPCRL